MQGACARFELYASDNTLQPMITRLVACVHVLERLNAEPAKSAVPAPQHLQDSPDRHGQTADRRSESLWPAEILNGGADDKTQDGTDTEGLQRESSSDGAGRSEGGAWVVAVGQLSCEERVKVEGEVERCEDIVSRLRTDVTMMLRHMSALQDEQEGI